MGKPGLSRHIQRFTFLLFSFSLPSPHLLLLLLLPRRILLGLLQLILSFILSNLIPHLTFSIPKYFLNMLQQILLLKKYLAHFLLIHSPCSLISISVCFLCCSAFLFLSVSLILRGRVLKCERSEGSVERGSFTWYFFLHENPPGFNLLWNTGNWTLQPRPVNPWLFIILGFSWPFQLSPTRTCTIRRQPTTCRKLPRRPSSPLTWPMAGFIMDITILSTVHHPSESEGTGQYSRKNNWNN